MLETQNHQVCLAEDGMPIIDNPPEHLEHQCFMLEVPMSRQDILKWSSAEHPEELVQVASAGKRARAEVQIKDLTQADRNCLKPPRTPNFLAGYRPVQLKPVLRKHLNPEQILKSRWVLTWKNVPEIESTNGQSRKAKARLVVLGYQDPRLTEVSRDAPTTNSRR